MPTSAVKIDNEWANGNQLQPKDTDVIHKLSESTITYNEFFTDLKSVCKPIKSSPKPTKT